MAGSQLSRGRGPWRDGTVPAAPGAAINSGPEAAAARPATLQGGRRAGCERTGSAAGLDANVAGNLQQPFLILRTGRHPPLGVCYVGCGATRAHGCEGGVEAAMGSGLGGQ